MIELTVVSLLYHDPSVTVRLHLCVFQTCDICGKRRRAKQFRSDHKTCNTCIIESHSQLSKEEQASDQEETVGMFDRTPHSGSPLSFIERSAIITMHKLQFDQSRIAFLIACEVSTVDHWIERYLRTGSLEDEARSGRPSSVSDEMSASIVSLSQSNPFLTPKAIRRALELNVSARTVRRQLDAAGLFARISRREYPLTSALQEERMRFANDFMEWGEDEWSRVVFSDESFIFLGQHGVVWVQRPEDTAYEAQYMTGQIPHSQRINMWACFSARGPGAFAIFDGNMDAPLLQRIMKTKLLPYAKSTFNKSDWYFVQDNSGVHTSGQIKQWIERNNVLSLKIPPRSPDLNPIENLWAIFKREVEKHSAQNIEQLAQVAEKVWKSLDQSVCQKLALSMPHRLAEVISNEGHKTHY